MHVCEHILLTTLFCNSFQNTCMYYIAHLIRTILSFSNWNLFKTNLAIDSQSFFAKNAFLDILEIFSLDTGQINFNLLKKAFTTWQHSLLSTCIVFYDIFGQAYMYARITTLDEKWLMFWGFFMFLTFFFCLSFFSFSYLISVTGGTRLNGLKSRASNTN